MGQSSGRSAELQLGKRIESEWLNNNAIECVHRVCPNVGVCSRGPAGEGMR